MNLQFHGDGRSLTVLLPTMARPLLQEQIARFPKKARLTFPRLYQEITGAQSSDFSYAMSRQELAWHQWLLKTRHETTIDLGSVEYLWKPDMEGNLVLWTSMPTRTFQWETLDRKWDGTIYLAGRADDDIEWMRHLCATFALQGDPNVFLGKQAADIQAMIKITELPATAD